MTSPALASRVRALLTGRLPPPVVRWCAQAAAAFDRQLRDIGAVAHRELIGPMTASVGMEPRTAADIGGVLDLLQAAIDLADNVADRAEDEPLGRDYDRAYRAIPYPSLVCLPSLMVGTALQLVQERIDHRRFDTTGCCRRILAVLGDMVHGQAVRPETARHVNLVSGKQGLLLCLPFWLVAPRDARWRRRLTIIERWAYQFGLTWEYRQIDLQRRTRSSSAALERSVQAARLAWPPFAPFSPDAPLSVDALLAAPVC